MAVSKPGTDQQSNFFPSAIIAGFGQSFFDPYDLSTNDDEYLTPTWVAEPTQGRSDHAVCFLAAARLYFTSPPEVPRNLGLVNPNDNDYHSDPMEISSTFGLPDITDW